MARTAAVSEAAALAVWDDDRGQQIGVPATLPTVDDFLRLPELKPALEFADGRIKQKVSPLGPHSLLQVDLCERFNGAGRAKRVALAFPELRTTFGGKSLVPDVAVYRWHRIARTAEGEVATYFMMPPDVAIEIVSPEQTLAEQGRKCRWYVDNGVGLAVTVAPRDRSLRVFRPGAEPVVLRGGERLDLGDIIPGFSLSPDQVFAALRID